MKKIIVNSCAILLLVLSACTNGQNTNFGLNVNEFNNKMREILGGTKECKQIVKNIIDEVQSDLKMDEFNESMNETIKFVKK